MKKFKFEVQSLIKVEIEAEELGDAFNELLANLESYGSQLVDKCNISDGEEIE